jgi:integrase
LKIKQSNVGTIELLPGKTERIVFDDDLPGFGLRVRDGGSRVYVTQYKLGAKQRRITLGSTKELTLVQARSRAKDVLAKVHLGEDPAGAKSEARARATDTFKAVTDRFLLHKEKKLRPASYYSTRLYLMKHLRLLHELRIDKIDRREIASRLSAIAEHHGAVSADRARSALSALFAWCVTQGIANSNPVIGTTKYAEPSSRDRVLSESELAAVWNALPDNDYGSVVKLLILTGCRADEIAWLRWSEIDIDGRKISLPGERTKNKRPFIVPLASTVVDILKGISRRHDRDLLFGRAPVAFRDGRSARPNSTPSSIFQAGLSTTSAAPSRPAWPRSPSASSLTSSKRC